MRYFLILEVEVQISLEGLYQDTNLHESTVDTNFK